MSFIPGMTGAVRMKPTRQFSLEPVLFDSFSPGGASPTFTGHSIGAVPGFGERRFVVAVAAAADSSGVNFTGINMNGVAMTEVVKRSGVTTPCGIFVAELAAGTTANFQINFGSTPAGVGLQTFRMINAAGTSPFATVTGDHGSGLISLSHNVPGGGGVIAVAQGLNAAGSGSNTWSGLTEVVDSDLFTNEVMTVAYSGLKGRAVGTPAAFSVQNSNVAPAAFRGCAASFSPA